MIQINDEFPQLVGLRYLNHAAVAPWPLRAARAVSAFAEQNAALGARDYPQWLAVERSLRQRLTRLLNAPSSADVALVKNTSEALSFVAFGLDWKSGDQIVISDEEFPSNRVVWEALQRYGVEVVQVNLKGADPEGDLLAACGPRVSLMAISAVQYASGMRLDLVRLGEGCEQRGVLLCIDAIQQLGALPFDVQRNRCAFAMADGHKWMLGPEGLGVFYCRSDLRERLKLHEYGWHMLEHAGDYDRTDWEPARSARRFECGSPNLLGAMALEASLSLLEEVGMEQVAKSLDERIEWLAQGLDGLSGIEILSSRQAERRSGIITFRLEHWTNAELFERLKAEQVVCALRGGGIRLSPHFYTPARVIDETLALLRGLTAH
ncbi:aminotransferase class V-fold PLP-dependent enzyme [Pseudomonas songnenensis]|uniref:Aminotransferase class V-fold PLP-dependent enzyme n=1 Tax=Pseudomonas songnenensis TaxID=1176259 RepID=A0ABX9UXP1_9PSED|nr:aminotransferase class V-fold PLP-dependent enzyme [Pseudomonas songnenensis]MCQ4299795.1 aminotransferase class V-fold PLP-dependent enzyme [Pseudomonas songnenensis]RMH98169.1 aminotransferase class V-fold PLP-dependent enzyme [Pseudomonas songnenensis]